MGQGRKTLLLRVLKRGGLVLLSLYVFGLLILWLGGGYVVARSGRFRIQIGQGLPLTFADTMEWQPRYGICQPDYQWPSGKVSPRCDFIGWAYYPFWIAIQKLNPTYAIPPKEDLPYEEIDFANLPEGFEIHPRLEDGFEKFIEDSLRNQKESAEILATEPHNKEAKTK